VRTCAHCGTSIDGYRSQARYCGGPCRAAASRKRATGRSSAGQLSSEHCAREETAHKRTQTVTEVVEWASLPADEQDRIERLLVRHADLLGTW